MDYVPVDSFRFAKGNAVTGPAILMPARTRDGAVLITGGADPVFCFLDGPHAGDGFPAVSASNFSGLAFQGIEFSVDWSSKFEYNLVDIPLGSLVVHDAGVDLVVAVKDQYRMDEARRFPLLAPGATSSDRSSDVGFSKWKAFQRQDGKLVEIYAFEATRSANA